MSPTLRDRAFQSFWKLQRSLTIGVRAVVTDETGRVLLVRHTYMPGWHFPGGGVERGETCSVALIRELREEAGVVVAGVPALVSVHANHAYFPNDHVLLYQIDGWTIGEASSRGGIAETGFFGLGALPAAASPGTRRRLAELFGGAAVAEHW